MEREDDFDIEEWSRQTRCVKCGNQLFPHNPKRAYVWAEHAYLKWNQTGLSPLMVTLRPLRSSGQ
mgnify:CR=1 FL=1